MQIASQLPPTRRPGARLCALVLGIALLALGIGTAGAVLAAPPGPRMDGDGPVLVRTGGSTLRMPDGAPGDTEVSYTTIEYRGGEPGAVRMYGLVTGGLAPHLSVRVTRGHGEGAGWIPDHGAPLYQGTLAGLSSDTASGIADPGAWESGERRTYRIAVTMLDHPAAQGERADATFRWEAEPIG